MVAAIRISESVLLVTDYLVRIIVRLQQVPVVVPVKQLSLELDRRGVAHKHTSLSRVDPSEDEIGACQQFDTGDLFARTLKSEQQQFEDNVCLLGRASGKLD